MTELRCTPADAGKRLDQFIAAHLPGLPAGLLHKYLRQNKIKLNGKKLPPGTRLAAGDVVRLYLPPAAEAPQPPPFQVLYEDAGLLAAYKPAGLLTLLQADGGGETPPPGAGENALWANADSLLARARRHAGGAYAPLPCHRLDTGTSGVVLFAKTPAHLDFFTGLIREHRLQKIYHGLSFGHPSPPAGVLAGWLAKDAGAATVRLTAKKAPGAKPVQAAYRTIATDGPLALLELCPKTGRTHQLRAQLAAAGTPLLGDSKYGNQAANRRYRCRYQCLCAVRLRFPVLEAGPFAAYSGLSIACEAPWFYQKLLAGGFAHQNL